MESGGEKVFIKIDTGLPNEYIHLIVNKPYDSFREKYPHIPWVTLEKIELNKSLNDHL